MTRSWKQEEEITSDKNNFPAHYLPSGILLPYIGITTFAEICLSKNGK
jgi:hypothetical protein